MRSAPAAYRHVAIDGSAGDMDVTCERCNTRYEFDAALVSSRGTTVKCTNCGHQFKVFRPADLGALDGWAIRTLDGRELSFKAMRELQAAITNGEVSTEDVLLPGDGSEPRRLGKIEELRSFFLDPEESTVKRPPRRGDTQPPVYDYDVSLIKTNVLGSNPGGHPPTASAGAPARRDREGNPLPTRTGTTLPPPTGSKPEQRPRRVSDDDEVLRPDSPTRERLPPEPPTLKGELPVKKVLARLAEVEKPSQSKLEAVNALHDAAQAALAGAPISNSTIGEADLLESNWEEPTHPRVELADGSMSGIGERPEQKMPLPAVAENSGVSQHMRPSVRFDSESIPPATPSPSVGRPSILRASEPYTDPRFTIYGPRGGQRSMVRWVIGLISVGVLGIVGFTLVRRYVQPAAKPSASAVEEDERVAKFLEEGDARLFAGDVEGAKDLYNKASGIAEHDPRVTHSLARVEVVRADLLWLHLRLLEDDAPNRAALARDLARAVERAEKATATAAQKTPDDPVAVAFKIDILRLKGHGSDAQKLVTQLKDGGADGGRVLAALDLLGSEPNYRSVVDRLQAAMRIERKLGRAHAMLVYALARSGNEKAAEKELEALTTQNASLALIEPLKRYVKDTEDRMEAEALDGDADEIPDDYREALKRAQVARKTGDLDRAERLYQAALKKKPGNREALAGLAELERDRGDTGGAEKRYQKMLDKNPDYVPAMLGLADLKWSSGKRHEALNLYRQVVRAAPGTDWAAHAQSRIDAGASAPASSSPQPAPEPAPVDSAHPQPQPPPAPAPSSSAPHVDVTDLPEYQ